GQPISGVGVTFAAPSGGASGTFAGGVTSVVVTTNSGGVATAPTFTANGTAGSYTVTATADGVSAPALFSLTNTSSTPVPGETATIQFASGQYTVNITDGTAQIALTRTGNLSATVTVVVSSPGGQDVAAFQQTVTFGPNATSATVTVPIQNNG